MLNLNEYIIVIYISDLISNETIITVHEHQS